MQKKKELRNGRREGEKAKEIKIAKKLLKKGAKIEEISDITDLTIEEIEKIKKSLK